MSVVAKLWSAALEGIDAELIEVEADLAVGLHSFSIVGLADKAVSEARERVNAALKNSGIKPPSRENRRITVNLAPADTKKVGSQFDLAIALAYLLASEQVRSFDASRALFVGELSLDGTLRPIHGALNFALLARAKNIPRLFISHESASQASVVKEIEVIPVRSLKELIEHLEEIKTVDPTSPLEPKPQFPESGVRISDVKGNPSAKRALLIAATGGHHMLMTGPPGTGKSMLAQALNSILPPPSIEECLEITKVWSVADVRDAHPFRTSRPFRAPHHSASLAALIGGGQIPKPGEVSLAHRGVLFLDELPEFHRDVIEGLRQPLESGYVHVARAKKALVFPARFMLIAAMNSCPCGYFEDPERECKCTAHEILRYQKKISGPLLDRIDIHIEVPRIPIDTLRAPRDSEEDERYRKRVLHAKKFQMDRLSKISPALFSNAEMSSRDTDTLVALDKDAQQFLKRAIERSFLSPRGYYRILKVARTIADLDASEEVRAPHLEEAFQYRFKNSE